MSLDLSPFDRAYKLFKEANIKTFTSLQGSSKALFLCRFIEPSILLTASDEDAEEIYNDTIFWSRSLGIEEPILITPRGHPHYMRNLYHLYTKRPVRLISSINSATSPLWKKDGFPILPIRRGDVIDRDSLISRLHELGYHRTPAVSKEGEMGIRAGIIDIFTPNEDTPIRVEFFGDRIESIRLFEIDTQLSIKEIDGASICPINEPSEGVNLLELLDTHILIIDEPDDMKRRYPDLLSKRERVISITSLPLKGDGFSLDIRTNTGLGLIPTERKTMDEFAKRVISLSKDYFILMVCSSESQARRLNEVFSDIGMDVPVVMPDMAIGYRASPVMTIGRLRNGFNSNGYIVLTESDIFGRRPVIKQIKGSRVSTLISTIDDLKEGDYIVHREHGIGRFLGIKRQRMEDYEGEFITIEYLGGDRLYVPLERIDCIQKYHAPENVKPPLDRLGGRTWLRTRQRVKKRIKEMARKLLNIYARRAMVKGHAFSPDTEMHQEFDNFFVYEETPDQLTAISEIKKEMEDERPMDMLLCGDVGYGKTEVAMRAAFKAVYDSKQVAVLVPTTILAEQHYNTFKDRFSAFPVRIEMLSRFRGKSEQQRIFKALSDGEIDIIIGTHILLRKDIRFHNLGLLIIDEEHRFGVSHKERIKDLKANIDVLTMTATPIPRTLQMALSGIRSMSVIETPPEERLSVISNVIRFDPQAIGDILRRELDRGGQAFFLHNRIQDIHKMADLIRGLLPDARIGVAHGRMRPSEIERVMLSFYRGETDILVTTAIIGSGIDIPTANTIIINMAERFGLADLYQLRGRVGRSNIRAYAYFLIHGEDALTEDARRRLMAIQELSYLGAGFRLALKDLEIRGAGNLLGPEQSGHIAAVGYDLYIQMLEEVVRELKGEEIRAEIEPHIDIRLTALIPDDYIDEPTMRLSMYRRIASIKRIEDIKRLKDEITDRFGMPPQEVLRLLDIMELKLIAKGLAITRIQQVDGRMRLLFSDETPVTPERLYKIYKERGHIVFLPERGIEIDLMGKSDILKELKEFLSLCYS
ncbi:MAG: transcription-repair coupling factor [Thermodesulfovibrionia bacterium]